MEEPASVAAQQSAPATSEAGTTVEDASEATVKSEAQATAEQAPPEVHREAYPDSQPPQHEQQPIASVDHQLPHIPQELQPGMTPVDPSTGAVQHVDPVHQIDPAALLGVPHGLAHLQHLQAPDLNGKFKPIDLESLSPKSRQRVMRNRQAATRSKAKKKQQYQALKDKKTGLVAEMEQLEAQVAAAQQRVAQLHSENKTLLEACRCAKE